MPDEAFRVVDISVGTIGEHAADRLAFLNIAEWRGGGVRIDDVDILWSHPGVGDRFANAFGLANGIGQNIIAGIRIDAVPGNLCVNFRSSRLSVVEAFQRIETAAFRDDD